jgi:hypothetical protein
VRVLGPARSGAGTRAGVGGYSVGGSSWTWNERLVGIEQEGSSGIAKVKGELIRPRSK